MNALERTGCVEAAARDSGIDKTTAYGRRRAHADFGEQWATALGRFREAKAARAKGDVERFEEEMEEAVWEPLSLPDAGVDARLSCGAASHPSTIASSGNGPPPHAAHGEDLVVRRYADGSAKVVKASYGRWTAAAERRFFAVLADTANVKAAAEAAGFSTTAVYARRMRHLDFRDKWAAAVETGRARLELKLIEAANDAFEKGVEDTPAAAPQVSVQEALHILKLGAEPHSPSATHSRRSGERAGASGRMATDAEVRAALVKSLRAFGVRVTKADLQARDDEEP